MRLKVLLMRPYADSDELIPPVGLGYLATALREKHEVQILDGIKEKLTLEKFADILRKGRYDIVGIHLFTYQIKLVSEYANLIKKILPDAKIVLGGPHPSCSPENIFEFFSEIDWAFKGEAEIGFAKLADLVSGNSLSNEQLAGVPGLIWRNDGGTQVNTQVFVENLDELGQPSWDLLRPDTYPLAPHGGFFKNYPIAPIMTTRGCPYSCTYCAGHLVSGRKIRSRSVAHIIEEIKLLYDRYGIREIHIEDDNFTFNREAVKEFCRQLKVNNLKISWTCPNGIRLDTLDEELLLAMKDAGLYSVSVGIESGSDRILKAMKKNLNTAQIREKIGLIKKCGLAVSGFFILGYPSETKQEILQTIRFAVELDLDRAGFFIFKPFPGTEVTADLLKSGELNPEQNDQWAYYVLADAVYAPTGLTKKELKDLRTRALVSFYFRPKIIFRFFKGIRNFQHFKIILKRIYSWLFKAK